MKAAGVGVASECSRGGEPPGAVTRTGRKQPRGSRLWLWFVGACLLQVVVWIIWLVIAAHHKVQEVPLVTGG
jgi:hypothetical protein